LALAIIFVKFKLDIKIIVIISLIFLLKTPVFAASVEISSVPGTIEKDQEFDVQINLSGAAANSINYLRGAFFLDSSPTSYFGYTFNHENSWYNGTPSPIDHSKFLQVSINSEGSFSGILKVKADLEDSAFKGAGTYKFKAGRYTASGGSIDWSNAMELFINAPSPTPTNVPTSAPSSTPNPTNTPKPTATSSPTSASTKTPSKSPVTPKVYGESNILGDSNMKVNSDSQNASPTPQDTKLLGENQKSIDLAKILIILGAAMIGGSALWIFIKTKKQRLNLHS